MPQQDYRGDVSPQEAWAGLADSADAVLVDVRTLAEWSYVGVPVLDSIGKQALFIEWQSFPDGRQSSDFLSVLEEELKARGVGKDAPLYFLCRSGSRSRSAAIAATAAGFANCFNIGPGFEGPLDGNRQRSTLDGWRVAGLPWSQT